jgi:hypothetical protein
MKRITLSLSFVSACLLSAACAEDPAVTCEVVWTSNGAEVGSATLVYDGLDDVDEGLANCLVDQADDPARPAEATMHECNCST